MQQLAFALFNGVATGMAIFLVAAGVTLIFGVLKIINFSHGAFFMLGAYLAFSFLGDSISSVAALLTASLGAGLIVGAFGFVVDKVVLARIRNFDEHFVLIATFALLLVVSGGVKAIWGVDYHSVSPPDSLAGAFNIGGVIIPSYSIFVIAIGLIAFLVLDIGLHRLWVGKVLRSLVSDSWAVGLLGYNVSAYYLLTVILAFFLAGAAGALLLPNQSLAPTLADAYLLLGFVCCIIGGLGNVRGAFLAALMLGTIESLTVVMLNGFPGLTVYVGMVLALLFRPQGLFVGAAGAPAVAPGGSWFPRNAPARTARAGSTSSAASASFAAIDLRLVDRPRQRILLGLAALGVALAISLPAWANPGLMFLAGLTIIEALFALSWHFLFGYAGVVSFGHAAFFAIGAYGVGFMLKSAAGAPFLLMLLFVAIAGALAAALVGLITLRRASGIYLAILTMSLAEIFRILVGYSAALGRDDGLAAIPRPVIEFGFARINLADDKAYYYFIIITAALCAVPLWWLAHSRFGRVLKSLRQDPERTSFIGVDVARYRLAAFTISGAFAAIAGGLSAPWTQIVTPEAANLTHSVSPVLNTLLGGAISFWGPVVGAVAFAFVGFATRTFAGLSEIMIGATLLVVVLAAPEGILGFLRKAETWLSPARRPVLEKESGAELTRGVAG